MLLFLVASSVKSDKTTNRSEESLAASAVMTFVSVDSKHVCFPCSPNRSCCFGQSLPPKASALVHISSSGCVCPSESTVGRGDIEYWSSLIMAEALQCSSAACEIRRGETNGNCWISERLARRLKSPHGRPLSLASAFWEPQTRNAAAFTRKKKQKKKTALFLLKHSLLFRFASFPPETQRCNVKLNDMAKKKSDLS